MIETSFKPRIRHTNLPVADLERSIDFYTRLLGMVVMRRRVNEARKQAVAYVGYGAEDSHPCLELQQDIGSTAPERMDRWEGHVALAVSDLYKLCAALENEGFKFRLPPQPLAPGRKDLLAFVFDPDGYEIELTERFPSA